MMTITMVVMMAVAAMLMAWSLEPIKVSTHELQSGRRSRVRALSRSEEVDELKVGAVVKVAAV
jgi:hypothetical protein